MKRALVFVVLLGAVALPACDGCGRGSKPTARAAPAGCSSSEDCADTNPCTLEVCSDGECVRSPVDEGTSCDNGDVCDGVARCDDRGRCVAGAAPESDDGNPCTLDACDPVRGVSHVAIAVDDLDPCTADACDPRTGIRHDSVSIDDGNDCTFDSCDPVKGIRHEQPSSFYTCDAGCGAGFHASVRRPSPKCGSATIETFCAPDCGSSFYSCEPGCPLGYRKHSEAPASDCGPRGALRIFCSKG